MAKKLSHQNLRKKLKTKRKSKLKNSTLLVVAIAMIDENSRVLLAERPTNRSMAGLWEFPGGKIDKDETPELALCREIKEELGVILKPQNLKPFFFASHQYKDFHLLMPLYLCSEWEGVPKPLEGQKIEWVKIKDIFNFSMPDADIPLAQALQEKLLPK